VCWRAAGQGVGGHTAIERPEGLSMLAKAF
jgi:hypothetical protein